MSSSGSSTNNNGAAPITNGSTNNAAPPLPSAPAANSASNGKPQRTIQVKIGNQAAKSMTPDQAADYLKSIAASGTGFFSGSGFHREVKMTFDNGSTSTVALPRVINSSNQSNSNTSKGNAALLLNGTVRSSSSALASNNNSLTSSAATATRADGMPCSEKEMKALMSMFVEIMGLQMNTDRLNQVSSSGNGKLQKSPTKAKGLTSSSKPASTTALDAKSATNNSSKTPSVVIQRLKKNKQEAKSSCLKITTTQKIGPNEVITATMSTSLPANKDNLFQFPTDLPPPPGGWPEDLLWPDKNKKHKIIIRNGTGIDGNDGEISDVDEDDDEGKEGETVVVITTTTVDDSDDDDSEYDDDEDVETDSECSENSLPDLEAIPDVERTTFRLWQHQKRLSLQKQQKQLRASQKRHELLVVGGTILDDDDDITLGDSDEDLVVTGSAGIVPFEWGALERAAMEDALEQEERIRKETNKKRQESNSLKSKKGDTKYRHMNSGCNSLDGSSYADSSHMITNYGPSQAEYNSFQKKVDAANKKLGKAVQSWRNRVAAACQSNEVSKLKALLNGGTLPFNTTTGMATTTAAADAVSGSTNSITSNSTKSKSSGKNKQDNTVECENINTGAGVVEAMSEEDRLVQQQFLHPHLEVLVPHCVPKQSRHPAVLQKGQSSRELLTSFILRQTGGLYFLVQPLLKAGTSSNCIIFGRSALDMACFYGDEGVVRLIVPELLKHFEADKKIMMAAAETGVGGSGDVPRSYHNFLHQTCQDSGWTPLHYAAISGSLQTVELLLQCEYSISYNAPATYKNKSYQLLPVLYIRSNDTLTWRKHGTGGKGNSSAGSPSCGIIARELVEFVKNGISKKEIESHGMALEEVMDYFYMNNGSGGCKSNKQERNLEAKRYLAMLNLIHQRLLDCEMNGYHEWDDETIQKEIGKALDHINTDAAKKDVAMDTGLSEMHSSSSLAGSIVAEEPVVSSSSVATNSTSKQSGSSKKKKQKKARQPATQTHSESGSTFKSSASVQPSVSSGTSTNVGTLDKPDDPVVAALLGMGFVREQIMNGVKACGGLDRATVDDVVAWIFGGGESPPEQEPPVRAIPPPAAPQTTKGSKSTIDRKESKKIQAKHHAEEEEEERIATEQKLVAKREEQRRRNREWNNRAQARQVQEDQEKLVKATVEASTSQAPIVASSVRNHGLRTGVPNFVPPTTGLSSGLPPLAPGGQVSTTSGTGPNTTSNIVSKVSSSAATSVEHPLRASRTGVSLGSGRGTSSFQPSSQFASNTANAVASKNNLGAELENIYSNDTSSMASSAEVSNLKCPPLMRSIIIEVSDINDDATVSTIGSTPAIIIQQLPSGAAALSSSAYAPPGFDQNYTNADNGGNTYMMQSQQPSTPSRFDDGALGTSARSSRQQWENNEFSPTYAMSDLNLNATAYIPPSSLQQNSYYGMYGQGSVGFGEPGNFGLEQQRRRSDASNQVLPVAPRTSDSVRDAPFSMSGLGQSGQMATFTPSASGETSTSYSNREPGFLLGSLDHSSVGQRNLHELRAAPVVPGLNIESFGLPEYGTSFEPNLESSLIESISTGLSGLPWGNTANSRTKGSDSSFLLGNVINSGIQMDDPFATPTTYDHLIPFSSNMVGAQSSSGDAISSASLLHSSHQGSLSEIGLVGNRVDRSANGIDSWLERERNDVVGGNLQSSSRGGGVGHSLW